MHDISTAEPLIDRFGRAVPTRPRVLDNGTQSGVTTDAPGGNEDHTFLKAIFVGEITLSEYDVHRLIEEMRAKWRGCEYHVLHRNCHHFADALLRKLHPDWRLPEDINSLARTLGSALSGLTGEAVRGQPPPTVSGGSTGEEDVEGEQGEDDDAVVVGGGRSAGSRRALPQVGAGWLHDQPQHDGSGCNRRHAGEAEGAIAPGAGGWTFYNGGGGRTLADPRESSDLAIFQPQLYFPQQVVAVEDEREQKMEKRSHVGSGREAAMTTSSSGRSSPAAGQHQQASSLQEAHRSRVEVRQGAGLLDLAARSPLAYAPMLPETETGRGPFAEPRRLSSRNLDIFPKPKNKRGPPSNF